VNITIHQPVESLYRFWRNFENLPFIMSHLEKIEVLDGKRSRWTAKAPVGTKISWEAEIINEVENEVIGWRSLPEAQVANAGSVRFSRASNGIGTDIKVEMEYVPPAGAIGAALLKLLGHDPQQTIKADLERFKDYLESSRR
jgi:uncharacterized membrane protein